MGSGEPARELPVVEKLLGDPFSLRSGLGLGGRVVAGGVLRGRRRRAWGRGLRLLEELAAEATLDRLFLDLLSAKRARLHRPDLAPNRARNLVNVLPLTSTQYATAPVRM